MHISSNRNWKYENDLASLLWKIDYKDIAFKDHFVGTLNAKSGAKGRVSVSLICLYIYILYTLHVSPVYNTLFTYPVLTNKLTFYFIIHFHSL